MRSSEPPMRLRHDCPVDHRTPLNDHCSVDDGASVNDDRSPDDRPPFHDNCISDNWTPFDDHRLADDRGATNDNGLAHDWSWVVDIVIIIDQAARIGSRRCGRRRDHHGSRNPNKGSVHCGSQLYAPFGRLTPAYDFGFGASYAKRRIMFILGSFQ
jgi:hypothetical protein